MDMTMHPQTLEYKAIGLGERPYVPPRSADLSYNYRQLDFMIMKNAEGTRNNAFERNAALRRQFYTERNARKSPPKTENADSNDPKPNEELENIEESPEPGSFELEMMPCHKYLQPRKKKPLPDDNAIPEEVQNKSAKPAPKGMRYNNYMKPENPEGAARKTQKNMLLKNPQFENMINRYVKNDEFQALLEEDTDTTKTPAGDGANSNNSQRQTPESKPKSNEGTFFMTEVTDRKKPLPQPRNTHRQINTSSRTPGNTSAQRSLPSTNRRANQSPNITQAAKQPNVKEIKKPTIGNVSARPARRLYDISTITKSGKAEDKRKKVEPKPQFKPMRYNMIRTDYHRSVDSNSSRDSRGLSTIRTQRNMKGISPEPLTTRRGNITYRTDNSRNDSSSSRSNGIISTSRSPANFSPDRSIPSLRRNQTTLNAHRMLKRAARPPEESKARTIDNHRPQYRKQPQQQQLPQYPQATMKEMITNLLLMDMRTPDLRPSHKVTTININQHPPLPGQSSERSKPFASNKPNQWQYQDSA